MLDIAKERFEDAGATEVTYLAGDYSSFEDVEPYDAIISSLSIHHLEDEAKQALFSRIFQLLKPGGVFVNADQVLGETPFLDGLYRSDWVAKIEATDLSQEALQAAYERTKLDKMAPLDAQLGWLRDSGFKDVDCVYKSYNFVVMFARKPYLSYVHLLPDHRLGHHKPHHRKRNDHIQDQSFTKLVYEEITIFVGSFQLSHKW